MDCAWQTLGVGLERVTKPRGQYWGPIHTAIAGQFGMVQFVVPFPGDERIHRRRLRFLEHPIAEEQQRHVGEQGYEFPLRASFR